MKKLALLASAAALTTASHAGLILTLQDTDGTATSVVNDNNAQASEYAANYGNGGGSGFGGTLGAGAIRMDASASSLHFGLAPGNSLNDVVVIYLDTKAGGFTDATMNDTSDGGRSATTNLTRDADDAFPVGFEADYAVVIAGWGSLSFELTGGSLNYMNNFNASKEVSVSRADLGLTSSTFGFNWFAAYCAESMWNSNESMPYNDSFNGGGNPGQSGPGNNYENYNRFEVVPEPASMTALALGALAMVRRRRTR